MSKNKTFNLRVWQTEVYCKTVSVKAVNLEEARQKISVWVSNHDLSNMKDTYQGAECEVDEEEAHYEGEEIDTKFYQPTDKVLHETMYASSAVWTTKEAAARDCHCDLKDIRAYDYGDIEDPIVVG